MLKDYLKQLGLGSLLVVAAMGCNSSSDKESSASDSSKPLIPSSDLAIPETSDASSGIDLSNATIYGGSTKTVMAKVDVVSEKVKDNGIKFWMPRTDPREGDFSAMDFTIDDLLVGEGYEIQIDLVSTYLNKKRNADFMAYEVLMDNEVLLTEDVAKSDAPNEVKIRWKANSPQVTFTIRAIALKDCPPYDWGLYGSPIIVKKVVLEPVMSVEDLSVTASSPFTTIL